MLSATNRNIPIFYRFLAQIRPAGLGAAMKKVFFISRRELTTTSNLRLWIDPVSQFGMTLWRQGAYEPELTKVMEILLRPGDTFIDVGANEGYFSLVASRLVASGSVEAFEPQQRLQPVIQRNLELNGAKNVHVHALALSDEEGKEVLYLSQSTNSGASSFYRKQRFFSAPQTVPTETLSHFFSLRGLGRARLIKIDCEGAETKVVPGMVSLLKEKRFDFIVLEFHPSVIGDKRCEELGRLIKREGYALSRIGSGQWIFHLPELSNELGSLGPVERVAWGDA